jgi:hypothetical protein
VKKLRKLNAAVGGLFVELNGGFVYGQEKRQWCQQKALEKISGKKWRLCHDLQTFSAETG